jgi:hypothetical protein
MEFNIKTAEISPLACVVRSIDTLSSDSKDVSRILVSSSGSEVYEISVTTTLG